MFRVGLGHDMHPFAPEEEGRPLVLGGVEVPGSGGLKGHSDADVLLHSICDAILGALGQGDLGSHFPDTDPELEGISSLVLAEKVAGLMKAQGYRLINLDAVIVAQAPRIAPHVAAMKAQIARVLEASEGEINLKATSPEGIGGLGGGEGIAAESIVLLERA